MISIESFIAEIKADLEAYDNAGLIDEISIYKWVTKACLKFGANIMELQDTVIEVNNSQGVIPSNFYSMYIAYKCDKKGYSLNKKEDKKVLQQTVKWVERVERNNNWQICDPTEVKENEKVIVEKTYYGGMETNFHYNNPVLLKLGRTMKRDICHSKCRNKIVRDCPYEININKTTLFTNFNKGDVYMQYYGLPLDEEGRPVIPHTPKGEVETYLEYHVKRKILEKILTNNDDPNVRTLFQYYVQKEDSQLGLALTGAKFSRLTPNSFKRLKKINRAEMRVYELMFPLV